MAVKQATVFNPTTGQRRTVDVGDPNAFAGGWVLETPTDNYQTRTMGAYDVTNALYPNGPQSSPTPTGLTPLNAPAAVPTAPTPSPVVNSAPAATAPTSNGVNTPTGTNSAFQAAFGQLMAKGKQDQALQDQKNLLIKQIYDTPLTPDQLRTLSPAQQEAIRNGDKGLIEFQILTLNDMIKGRADENTTALQYMMDGYKLDQEAAESKKQTAFTSFANMMAKFPDIADAMSDEGFAAFQRGELPPPEDMRKVYSAYRTSLAGEKLTDTSAPSSVKEYEYYLDNQEKLGLPVLSFDEWQTEDANRKAQITGAGGLTAREDINYGKITSNYQTDPLIRQAQQAGALVEIADNVIADPTNGMTQLSGMYTFIKALDQNSAVREGETQLVNATQSYLTKFQNEFEKLSKDQLVLPEVAKAMAEETKQLAEAWFKLGDKRTQQFRAQAKGYGANVEAAFDEYLGGFDSTYAKPKTMVGPGGVTMVLQADGTYLPQQMALGEVAKQLGIQQDQYERTVAAMQNDPAKVESWLRGRAQAANRMDLFPKADVGSDTNARAQLLTQIPTDVKWGEGKRRTNIGQCGALVNDIVGLKMGDSLASKVKVCDPSLTPDDVEVGDAFVQAVKNDPGGYGHTGLINKVGTDPDGRKFAIVTEANWKKNGMTTHNRKIYLDDPLIKGFAKPKQFTV